MERKWYWSYYLFQRNPGAFANDAGMSAHGYYRTADGTFNVPTGVAITFYCAPDEALRNMGSIRKALNPAQNAIRWTARGTVHGPNACTNYRLFKYQMGHEEIEEGEKEAKREGMTFQDLLDLGETTGAGGAETYDMIKGLPSTVPFDVITIRNSSGMSTDGADGNGKAIRYAFLSDLVDKFKGNYSNFHCFFCRVQK